MRNDPLLGAPSKSWPPDPEYDIRRRDREQNPQSVLFGADPSGKRRRISLASERLGASACIAPRTPIKPPSKIKTPRAAFARAHPAFLKALPTKTLVLYS